MTESVVDGHVHFWDTSLLEYPWLEELPTLQRSFHPRHYEDFWTDVPVEGMVFVEANPRADLALEEVRFIEGLAAVESRIEAIVAYVDLLDAPGRSKTLEALAGHPLVRGIRHNIQGNPPGFALQREFVAGVREAGRLGYTFDLCVKHDQLEETLELARRADGTRLVLDHCGKPAIRAGSWEPWATRVRELAEFPHVWCKVSGLLTEADPQRWTPEEILRYAEHVVDSFGTDRVLYGSDWPVATLADRASSWYSLTRELTAGWSEGERRAFYVDNARAFYGGRRS